MTKERVIIGPGTLHNLLEQFTEGGFIYETKKEGRKRSYIITDKGKRILEEVLI